MRRDGLWSGKLRALIGSYRPVSYPRNFEQSVQITDITIFIRRVRNQIESQSGSAITH